MNVLVFLTFGVSFKNWKDSGIINRELEIYKKLKSNHNVNFTFISYGNVEDINLVKDFDVIPYYKYNKYLKSRILTFFQSIIFSLKLSKLTSSIDLIKTNQLLGSWMAIIVKILIKKPLIIRTGYDIYKFSIYEKKNILKRLFYFLLTQLALSSSNKYIVTSTSDKSFLSQKYYFSADKVVVLPNWVDRNFNKKIRDMKSRYEKKILTVGRLEEQKNLDKLVKLFSKSEIEIDVIGSGSKKNELEELAKKYNTKLNLIGNVNHENLSNIYENYRIFISTSLYEGNPKATLEAMGSGCLVIVSDIENNIEIINDKEDGLIHNYSNLLELVKEFINNTNELDTFYNKAIKRIQEHNSLNIIIEKEFNLYSLLVPNN